MAVVGLWFDWGCLLSLGFTVPQVPPFQFPESKPLARMEAMSAPLPHEQRVIDEKSELDEKASDLECFIMEDAGYMPLSDQEKDLLSTQLRLMKEYSVVLGKRIVLFIDPREMEA
jgi:hypothetical protein